MPKYGIPAPFCCRLLIIGKRSAGCCQFGIALLGKFAAVLVLINAECSCYSAGGIKLEPSAAALWAGLGTCSKQPKVKGILECTRILVVPRLSNRFAMFA